MEPNTIISLLTAIAASLCLVAWARYIFAHTRDKISGAHRYFAEARRLLNASRNDSGESINVPGDGKGHGKP